MKVSQTHRNILRVIGFVSSIIMVLVGLTQVIDFFEKRAAKLEAYYFDQAYSSPTIMSEKFDGETLEQLYGNISNQIINVDSCADFFEVRLIVRENFDSIFSCNFFRLHGIFNQVSIVITNNQNIEAKNVILEAFSTGYYDLLE